MAKKLGDQYIVGPQTQKLGDQSLPVPTVVALMQLVLLHIQHMLKYQITVLVCSMMVQCVRLGTGLAV